MSNNTQHIRSLVEELNFLEAQLEAMRGELEDAPVTVEYIDSQGRPRVRANPLREEYRQTFRSFCSGVSILMKSDGEEAVEAAPMLSRFKVARSALRLED